MKAAARYLLGLDPNNLSTMPVRNEPATKVLIFETDGQPNEHQPTAGSTSLTMPGDVFSHTMSVGPAGVTTTQADTHAARRANSHHDHHDGHPQQDGDAHLQRWGQRVPEPRERRDAGQGCRDPRDHDRLQHDGQAVQRLRRLQGRLLQRRRPQRHGEHGRRPRAPRRRPRFRVPLPTPARPASPTTRPGR